MILTFHLFHHYEVLKYEIHTFIILCYFSTSLLLLFCCRTGEAALGYGEVAEECLRRYWPKRAYVGRLGNIFTIYSPPPPPKKGSNSIE